MNKDIIFMAIGVFVGITIFLLILILLQKRINRKNSMRQGLARDYLFKRYFDNEPIKRPVSAKFFFNAFIDIETQVSIEPVVRKKIIEDILKTRFCKKQYRNLNSLSKYKRKLAVFYLQSLELKDVNSLFEKRLEKERNDSVRFFILYALKAHINERIFDLAMNSLSHSDLSYPRWVYAIFKNNYDVIRPFISKYFTDERIRIKKFLLYLASNVFDANLRQYAFDKFEQTNEHKDIKKEALYALSLMYPEDLITSHFLEHEDLEVRKVAIRASAIKVTQEMVDYHLNAMDGTLLDLDRANALSRIVFDSKTLLIYLLNYYPKSKTEHQRLAISRVLSHHIDYLMLKLKSDSYPYITEIIEDLLKLHIVEDFIDFMNINKDKEVEKIMLNIIKKYATQDKFLLDEFSIYLNQRILNKLGLIQKPLPTSVREKAPVELTKVIWTVFWIVVAITFMPILFFFLNLDLIFSNEPLLTPFLISLNTYLSVYFIAVNSIYLILLLFSLKGANERDQMWSIKKQTLLFEHDLLPSISIIAPAYNEEKSIIESVTSLLNLKYPKYEVIVVNDGSKDDTIGVLVKHFELERKHPFFQLPLKTKPLRSVYVSKQIPNLIVIDKQNGGKADALNLGINVAKNDYICGIDADSLLDEDALLKLMSVTLDDAKTHIALGGNIVPVNGCIVDKGKIEQSGLGKNPIVRFQTLEYLRAFTTGRIGWSKLHSLLIVSGAFGLFNRKSLIDTGGYLTISGDLKKDTVGEDMELVVRLTYKAIKDKLPYRVEYVHHANCYTELPSDMTSLLKQRNRWQRGLLDILSYHRSLLFNPRYKQPGLIGFPYFFIFEMMGPFLELIGYLALIAGFILGILNVELVILLFYATIGYGIYISLVSLWISERRNDFYPMKHTLIMIMIAIAENFGFRQLMSLHRIKATISSLKESGHWGSQNRTGFQKK